MLFRSDQAAPRNPVYLTAKSLHAGWANSAALKLAGITVNTPDPENGKILEYLPIGSDVTRKTDARIIAATNVDPENMGEPERFRSDLYYRLRAHHVHLPPLRERREDLPLLIDHFMRQGCQQRKRPGVPPELLALLAGYAFPGNIRELQFLILDALSCSGDEELNIDRIRAHVDKHPKAERKAMSGEGARLQFGPELPTLKQVCTSLVREAVAIRPVKDRLFRRAFVEPILTTGP